MSEAPIALDLPTTPEPPSRVRVVTLPPASTQTPIDLSELRAERTADFEKRMAELIEAEGELP